LLVGDVLVKQAAGLVDAFQKSFQKSVGEAIYIGAYEWPGGG
jgi:hypothetical protein